jgi:sugar transferase (PEP-CTERM/EpsH1 system associated)
LFKTPLNILYLQTEIPYPPTSGGRARAFHLIRELGKRHAVTLLSLALPETSPSDLRVMEGFCKRVFTVPFRRAHSISSLLKSLAGGEPYKVRQYHSAEFARRTKELMADNAFDLIISEHVYLGQFLPENFQVVVPQNIEMVGTIYERTAQHGSFMMRWYARGQSKKILQYELNLYRKYGVFIALTSEEEHRIRLLIPGIVTAVIPNGVDADFFSPASVEPYDSSIDIVFTGSFSYYPNEQAALYFAHTILPLVKKQLPGVKFFIVGKDPGPGIRNLGHDPSITVTGLVNDIRPYLKSATVVVAPLLLGSGTRLKILEAMAMGKAVVSTSIGAEGLDVRNGKNIFIADAPQEFADAVVEILKNAEKRREIGQHARALIDETYRWERIGEVFNNFVFKVAGDDPHLKRSGVQP